MEDSVQQMKNKPITEEEYREFVEFVDDYNRKLQQKIDKWHSSFNYRLYSILKVQKKKKKGRSQLRPLPIIVLII